MDPTARGDHIAAVVRGWYEGNRESWWDRHKPGADRYGQHADNFMLRLVDFVNHIEKITPR